MVDVMREAFCVLGALDAAALAAEAVLGVVFVIIPLWPIVLMADD